MFTKKVLKEVEVIDIDKIAIGTKVFYQQRDSYGDFNDWSSVYDEGHGVVVNINEDYITFIFDGYSPDRQITLGVDDLNSGFHKITIV